ncbi:MAG: UDP-glucose/GDP-mannose dehydrogenase family protein [Planctomycetes bacterium]|nr:UDP-glucose/GDP-mannose dehydrogenase family protein [Planctomycetota bacterium]
MDVSVLGLGYVGTVCAGCLAGRGHRVVGCDIEAAKVEAINSGASPIQEPGLPELIRAGHQAGMLSATTAAAEAVRDSTISLVCVGTPSRPDGDIDLSYVRRVCEQIGEAVAAKGQPHTVVIRSTVRPNSLEEVVIPVLSRAAGAENESLLRVCVNPEFLREGTAVADFENPPMIVIGDRGDGGGDAAAELYHGLEAPLCRVGLKEAMMVKYACNLYHALKIIFGNEVGALCQADGIDSHQVMDVFCKDHDLNISARYLKPGYAYGGSCLPKDLRAMLQFGRQHNVETPVLAAVGTSNQRHIERCVEAVVATGFRKLGVLGLSFKDDTDDLRESPTVEIVERLIGKGLEVAIHDKDITLNEIVGQNLSFVQQHLPHIAALMRPTVAETVGQAEVILLTKPSRMYADVGRLVKPDQVLIDLVRFLDPGTFSGCRYVGLVG